MSQSICSEVLVMPNIIDSKPAGSFFSPSMRQLTLSMRARSISYPSI